MDDGPGQDEDDAAADAAPGAPLTRRGALLLAAGGAAVLAAAGAGLTAARSDGSGQGSAEDAGAAAEPAARFDPRAAASVLAARAAAVRDGDRTAFLATVGTAPAAFQEAQSRLYDNLRALPLDGWRERLAGTRAAGPGAVVARVETGYRLRGFDRTGVVRTRHLAFAPRSGTWTIVGDGTAHGLTDDADIVDGGALTVVRGRSCLVIGDTSGLHAIARRIDAAVPAVSGVVGTDWARRAVALVPAAPRLAAALAGQGPDLGSIAALATVTPGPDGPGRGEDRVIVSPATFARLNGLGRDVVLTHELTHVATGGARDRTTPLWLIEGLADYVGYRGAKVSVRSAARELRREVAAGRPPTALPTAEAFAGTSGRLSQSYQEAWLACRMIADRYGETTLVRLYRAAGRASEPAALRDVLGLTKAALTTMWRDYVKEELA
ncbi:hypothetical protein [Spirillospora albida]|uniref:hypothetical protein n=1 Tax=Spirillospora albida TaxID=58123 RepID=UPI0004C1D206|nr:hypothetical protein [Spirillospora albida]